MGSEDVVAAACYAIINMLISIAFGFLLRKLGVLVKINRQVLSQINYYVLVPIYACYFVMSAIDRNRVKEFGLILFSSLSSVCIGFIIVVPALLIMRTDIRYRFSLAFIMIYANVIVMPQMITDSTCDKGGKYVNTSSCKSALVKPYSSLPLIYNNLLYWITVLPIIQNEKRISMEMRKAMVVALNYYETINQFISDTTLNDVHELKLDEGVILAKIEAEKLKEKELEQAKEREKEGNQPSASVPQEVNTGAASPAKTEDLQAKTGEMAAKSNDFHKVDDVLIKDKATEMEKGKEAEKEKETEKEKDAQPGTGESGTRLLGGEMVTLTSEKFIGECFDRNMDYPDYNKITEAYKSLEEKLNSTPNHAKDLALITKYVLTPGGLMKPPTVENVLTWKFLKERILMSPPALCAILGVIGGFIFAFKEWLFDPNNKPLPTFLSTFSTLGGMMSPISMFLLGASIAEGAVVRRDTFVRWKHIIMACLMRGLIMPCLGLLWLFLVMRNVDNASFLSNPVLTLINYCFWIVPNGIILIAVYAYGDFFTMEFGILSVYMNIVSIPIMAIFLVIYFTIYETY